MYFQIDWYMQKQNNIGVYKFITNIQIENRSLLFMRKPTSADDKPFYVAISSNYVKIVFVTP